MRRSVVVLAMGVGLVGCGKREVCEIGMGFQFAPADAVWKPYLELLPPSATVCGHMAIFGGPNKRALNIDFADDPSPAEAMAKHLEAKGWKREIAALENPDVQSIKLTRGEQTLRATTNRDKGRVRAVLELEEATCAPDARRTGPGYFTCREKEIVKCEPGTRMFATVKACPGTCKAFEGEAHCE